MSSISKRKVHVPSGLSLDTFTYAAIPQVVKSILDANPTLGESERDYLLTLLTECLKEAVEKRHRSGEAYDWNLMVVQTCAFVPPEQAFHLVELLLQKILEHVRSMGKQEKGVSKEASLEAELRLAREKVAATLKPPAVITKRDALPREHARKPTSSASKFDPFDPSLKVPSQMEDALRKRAVDYARDHSYNLYHS